MFFRSLPKLLSFSHSRLLDVGTNSSGNLKTSAFVLIEGTLQSLSSKVGSRVIKSAPRMRALDKIYTCIGRSFSEFFQNPQADTRLPDTGIEHSGERHRCCLPLAGRCSRIGQFCGQDVSLKNTEYRNQSAKVSTRCAG